MKKKRIISQEMVRTLKLGIDKYQFRKNLTDSMCAEVTHRELKRLHTYFPGQRAELDHTHLNRPAFRRQLRNSQWGECRLARHTKAFGLRARPGSVRPEPSPSSTRRPRRSPSRLPARVDAAGNEAMNDKLLTESRTAAFTARPWPSNQLIYGAFFQQEKVSRISLESVPPLHRSPWNWFRPPT